MGPLHGDLSAKSLCAAWSKWKEVDFAPPLTAKNEQGGLSKTVIGDIKSMKLAAI